MLEVNIGSISGPYASGGLGFRDAMGGGWFLGYKDGGIWVIVEDGNGMPTCSVVEPFSFPVAMVPNCALDDGTPKDR